MPYNVNDNLDFNNFPPASNLRQAVDILATQIKELSGKSSWKDKPDYSLANILVQPSLKGDKGDTGLQGIQGVKGDKGDTGATGAKGQTGYWHLGAKATVTGTTAYTTLATVTIQPSALTVNNVIRIIAIASYLAGGLKTFRIRIGSVVIFSVSLSALGGSLVLEKIICFQNSLSVNVTPPSGLNGVGANSNQPIYNVANFNNPQTIIFEVQNTLVTDTTILESALVEII